MIQDRIAKIEETLAATPDLPAPTREELLRLLSELKSEVAAMAPAHGGEAQSIAQSADAAFTAVSHPRDESSSAVLDDFRASVEGFEASHPRLVQIVDRIAQTLSNMGI